MTRRAAPPSSRWSSVIRSRPRRSRDPASTRSSRPRCGDEVVDRAGDEHRPDEVSKIGHAGNPSRRLPPTLMNVLMNGFDHVFRRSLPKSPKSVGIRPDADVDDHQPAPDQGEDVEDGAPAAQVEPGALVRPTAAAGGEDADVAEEVAEIRSSRSPRSRCRSPRRRRSRPGVSQPARPRRSPHSPASEGLIHVTPHAAERQPPVASHGEHEPDGRALDRQRAHVDGDQDHDEVQVAERDRHRARTSGSP